MSRYGYQAVRPHWIARLVMWRGWGRTLKIGILLCLACGVQGVWAYRMTIGFAQPDFGLLMMALIAFLSPPSTALWVGFTVGLIQASLIDQTLGSLLLSRLAGAYAVAHLPQFFSPRSYGSGIVAVAVGVIVSQSLLYLFAPSIGGRAYWETSFGILVYNCVMALPMFGLVRKLIPPEQEEESSRWNL